MISADIEIILAVVGLRRSTSHSLLRLLNSPVLRVLLAASSLLGVVPPPLELLRLARLDGGLGIVVLSSAAFV